MFNSHNTYSTKSKEKDDKAMKIKKQMENFDFLFIVVVQSEVLQIFLGKLCSVNRLAQFLPTNFCKVLLKILLNSEGVLTQ